MATMAVLALGCGDDGAEPAVARGVGDIRVAAIDAYYNPGQPVTTIEATFSAADPLRGCSVTTHGACELLDCSDADDVTRAGAGTLSVETGDGRVREDIELGAMDEYVLGKPDLLFVEGDSLTIAASGAEVPAFSLDAAFPPTFMAVEPMLTDSENILPIDSDTDTVVRVSGAAPGVELYAELAGATKTMRCVAPAGDAELTLSAEAMGEVGGGEVALRAQTRTTLRAGAYDVSATLRSAVMQGDGRRLVLTTQ
jgi:hypothetical protein